VNRRFFLFAPLAKHKSSPPLPVRLFDSSNQNCKGAGFARKMRPTAVN
jgi:hypothetical protein